MKALTDVFNAITVLQEISKDPLALKSEIALSIRRLHACLEKFNDAVTAECSFKISADYLAILYSELLQKDNFHTIQTKLNYMEENTDLLFSSQSQIYFYIATTFSVAGKIKEKIISAEKKSFEMKEPIEHSLQDQIILLKNKADRSEEEKKELEILTRIESIAKKLSSSSAEILEEKIAEQCQSTIPNYQLMAQAMLKLPAENICQIVEEDLNIIRKIPEKIDLILYWMQVIDNYQQQYDATKDFNILLRMNAILIQLYPLASRLPASDESLAKKIQFCHSAVNNNLNSLDFKTNSVINTDAPESQFEVYDLLNMRNNIYILRLLLLEAPGIQLANENNTRLVDEIKKMINHNLIKLKPSKLIHMIIIKIHEFNCSHEFCEIFFKCANAAGVRLPKSLLPVQKLPAPGRLKSALYYVSGALFAVKNNSLNPSDDSLTSQEKSPHNNKI
jgi:uncharacterized protein Yka (UPF0111/DUF47 family)